MAFNDNVGYDFDYGKRLEWLADLMEKFPGKKMRQLQKEAMHLYPIESVEGQRNWLSIDTGFKAAEICTARTFKEIEEDGNE